MVDAATYSAVETLRGGTRVDIRALRQDDRAELLAAVGRTSPESLYRRFFTVKRGFTEREVAYFLNIDFVDHVALVAVVEEASRPVIVGGARYIVMQPGKAEVAFAVIDEYQGRGIGAALMSPSRRDRPRRRAPGVGRRRLARERGDAEGVREERVPPQNETGVRRRGRFASARRNSLTLPHRPRARRTPPR